MHLRATLLIGLGILTGSPIIAAESAVQLTAPVGQLTQYEGKVYLHEGDSVRGKRIREIDLPLSIGHTLRTKRKSRAFVEFIDESQVILQAQSLLTIEGLKQIKAGEGKVLFSIKPQGGAKGLRIATRSAIIGVKGTQFLLDVGEDSLNVYLKEGSLDVDAIDGEFARYRKKEKDDYETYMREQNQMFDEYQKKLEKEYLEYVKSITMAADSAISIDGKEVRDIAIPDDVLEEFKLFKRFEQGSIRPAHEELEEATGTPSDDAKVEMPIPESAPQTEENVSAPTAAQ